MVRVEDCLHLGLPGQVVHNDRYYAEPIPGLGLAVYIIDSRHDYYCLQFFQRDCVETELDFVDHILDLAGKRMTIEEQVARRALYPYREAPDILTLSCIINNHSELWRKECASTVQP